MINLIFVSWHTAGVKQAALRIAGEVGFALGLFNVSLHSPPLLFFKLYTKNHHLSSHQLPLTDNKETHKLQDSVQAC